MNSALVRRILLTAAGLVSLSFTAAAANRSFVVAALKVMPAVGDKAANLARFDQLARQGAAAGADFIVTPECYLAHSNDCDMLMFGRVVLDERIHDRGSYRVRHPELYGPLVEPATPKK
jgi:hypothetical protein